MSEATIESKASPISKVIMKKKKPHHEVLKEMMRHPLQDNETLLRLKEQMQKEEKRIVVKI
jgi:hypothetical protein